MAGAGQTVVWTPQPGPQSWLVTCPVFDVLFGGARGGGKTDGMVGDWLNHSHVYGEHAIGLMVRRRRTELVETIERFSQVCKPLGAKLTDNVLRMPGGGRLRFAYLERDSDADAYQGHSYTRVYAEELGNFPLERPIRKLHATLRSGHGVPVGFRATANPGGPGHLWVRARYIDPAPAGMQIVQDEVTGLNRIYIPSRLADNRYLGDQYVAQLKGMGSPALVRAWLEGDWDAIEGAFFAEWSHERHVLEPFVVPAHWARFRSMDWGSAKPFSVGWWAVVGEDHPIHVNGQLVGRTLPRGALVRYREWYGSTGQPNVGLKLTATEVAKTVLAKSADEQFAYTALDPSMFAQNGGPSLAEMMMKAGLTGLRAADNTRIGSKGAMGGWDQLRGRLRGQVNDQGESVGEPMIYCFHTCRDSIRTIPVLQHDLDHPEDLDTDGEDHAGDDWRYAAMSRPWIPAPPPPPKADKSELRFEATEHGMLVSNMNVKEWVEARIRARNR